MHSNTLGNLHQSIIRDKKGKLMEQTNQKEINRKWIKTLYGQLTGYESFFVSTFNKLLPGQKKYLLLVSGLKELAHDDCRDLKAESLSPYQWEEVKKGLNRLRILVSEFNHVLDEDFIKEEKQRGNYANH